ncbi:phosphoserine phosphatase [soil metagenome]
MFDCDSTLCAIEGIDELAAGQRMEVAALTDAAMRGELPLEAVYARRLELIRPDRSRIEALARQYVETLVPDARDVVRALHAEGIDVRIMSGGLLPAVRATADALGIAHDRVAAVGIRFAADGTYAGFDEAAPLARSGGKRETLLRWRQDIDGAVMMVGDGATDLEARGVADLFVAYTGVIDRPEVVAEADVVIRSASLAPVLPLALAGDEPRAADSAALHRRGLALLEQEYRALLESDEPTETSRE